MILQLVLHPDPLLKQLSQPVKRVTKDLVELGENMLETMRTENALGLSAVQVGQLLRILTVKTGKGSLLMYNPIVMARSPLRRETREGCLSFPKEQYKVKRPVWVKVKYTSKNNKMSYVKLEGLEAVALLHELDHINGITFDTVGIKS